MKRPIRVLAAAGWLLAALPAGVALAQKPGGILKMYDPDSPASMSIHEEGTIVSERPMMGVFNNLVMFDQHVKQNSLNSVVPDLATSWSWNEDGTELTLPLRQGVGVHSEPALCLVFRTGPHWNGPYGGGATSSLSLRQDRSIAQLPPALPRRG